MKGFFNLCTEEIIASVDQQMQGLGIKYILLVGGFGDSPYLRREFKERYEPRGAQVTLTNEASSKAVADGAVIWNCSSSVASRAPRYSFGVITSERYQLWSPEHQGRISYMSPSGHRVVPGVWSQIVSKGIALDVEAVRRRTYARHFESATPNLALFEVDVYAYPGEDQPSWARNKEGTLLPRFQQMCSIKADLKHLSGALSESVGVHGEPYWSITFDICIRFGGTELEAYIEWEENGITRTGPATIIPDDAV